MMKLTKFFLGLLLLSIAGFLVAQVIHAVALNADISRAQLSLQTTLFEVLQEVSLISLIVSFIGVLVARDIENALLRRFGQSATATVLAVRYTWESVNGKQVKRIKLAVQPAQGASFVAVAEDIISSLQIGNVSPGATVPVKYDPYTKEVALYAAKVKKTRTKEDNF